MKEVGIMVMQAAVDVKMQCEYIWPKINHCLFSRFD